MLRVKVKTAAGYAGLPLPKYETAQAAGMDILACIDTDMTLSPGERRLIPTGLYLEIPAGYEAQVRPRSGLALKHGITCLNTPGTIDADYRGEVGVILINLGQEDFTVSCGMRIAQLVFAPCLQAAWQPEDELAASERGEGGFGHSGL